MKECSDVFQFASRRAKILSTLSWGRDVAAEFFKHQGTSLPNPVYEVDRKGLQEALEALAGLHAKLQGEHPVLQWLMRNKDSFSAGIRLILTGLMIIGVIVAAGREEQRSEIGSDFYHGGMVFDEAAKLLSATPVASPAQNPRDRFVFALALAKNPDERFASVERLAEALHQAAEGRLAPATRDAAHRSSCGRSAKGGKPPMARSIEEVSGKIGSTIQSRPPVLGPSIGYARVN